MNKLLLSLLLLSCVTGFGQKYDFTLVVSDSTDTPVVLLSAFGIHSGSKGIIKVDLKSDTLNYQKMKPGKYAFQFRSATKEAKVIFELQSDTTIQVILRDPDDPAKFRD